MDDRPGVRFASSSRDPSILIRAARGTPMNKEKEISSSIDSAPGSTPHRSFEDRLHYLLADEEQILNSITARASLPRILNAICLSLDCQMGNMVSLISLGADESTLEDISRNAKLFGLHIYFSAEIEA